MINKLLSTFLSQFSYVHKFLSFAVFFVQRADDATHGDTRTFTRTMDFILWKLELNFRFE